MDKKLIAKLKLIVSNIKKLKIRSNLIIILKLYTLVFLAIPMIFSIFNIMDSIKQGKSYGIWICYILAMIILYFFIMNIYRKKIYKPIITIENIIHGIVQGKTDLELSQVKEGDSLYPIYCDLKFMIEKLEDLVAKESTAKLMKKQAELDALQHQINPHFLYNTLESIRGQALVYGLKDIETMVQALSNLFRYSISNQESMVTLSQEIKNTENYLKIQQYRFNNKFIIINRFDEDTLDCLVPKLIIQPIVENSILHGLESKIGKGTLTFKAYKTEKRLIINVQDDGLGIEFEKLVAINDVLTNSSDDKTDKAGMNIGLVNVNERIKLNFGNDYGIRIYSSQNVGTNVEISLPLLHKS